MPLFCIMIKKGHVFLLTFKVHNDISYTCSIQCISLTVPVYVLLEIFWNFLKPISFCVFKLHIHILTYSGPFEHIYYEYCVSHWFADNYAFPYTFSLKVPYKGPLIWVILLVLGQGFCGMTLGLLAFDLNIIISLKVVWNTSML